MPTAAVSVTGEASDLPFGDKTVGPVTMVADPCVSSELQITFPAGNTTITKPTGATICVIVFPSTSTANKSIRGVGGDTGINVGPTGFVAFPLHSSVTSFVVNSSAADTDRSTIMFL